MILEAVCSDQLRSGFTILLQARPSKTLNGTLRRPRPGPLLHNVITNPPTISIHNWGGGDGFEGPCFGDVVLICTAYSLIKNLSVYYFPHWSLVFSLRSDSPIRSAHWLPSSVRAGNALDLLTNYLHLTDHNLLMELNLKCLRCIFRRASEFSCIIDSFWRGKNVCNVVLYCFPSPHRPSYRSVSAAIDVNQVFKGKLGL